MLNRQCIDAQNRSRNPHVEVVDSTWGTSMIQIAPTILSNFKMPTVQSQLYSKITCHIIRHSILYSSLFVGRFCNNCGNCGCSRAVWVVHMAIQRPSECCCLEHPSAAIVQDPPKIRTATAPQEWQTEPADLCVFGCYIVIIWIHWLLHVVAWLPFGSIWYIWIHLGVEIKWDD